MAYTPPTLLSYPEIKGLDELPEIQDQFVYVIRAYATKGLAVLINRKDDKGKNVYLQFGDFDGKVINPTVWNNDLGKAAQNFLEQYNGKFVSLMASARIQQAIYYLTTDLQLVDMRTSLNKFAGPGMLRDLYSKIIPTQTVVKTIKLNPDIVSAIKDGAGDFKGDLILKTSAFKTITRGTAPNLKMFPMYAKVVR